MVKRVGFVIGAVLIVALAGIAFYFLQLTAPVGVSQSVPLAPTLVVPAAATQAAAAAAAGFPPRTPRPGFPPGGFRRGTPPPGGFPPGGGPGGGAGPVSTSPPAAPTLAAAGSAQVYRVDATHSKVSYNANETFLQDFAGHATGKVTTVGTTQAIAGDILVDRANPAASQVGEIVVDISQFQSDTAMRDNAIRRQWLESAKYPLATFKATALTGLPAAWPLGTAVRFQIMGDLTVHATTQQVTWDATATLDGNTLHVQATTNVQISQFGMHAPQLPMLTVEDPVTLTLDLVAT